MLERQVIYTELMRKSLEYYPLRRIRSQGDIIVDLRMRVSMASGCRLLILVVLETHVLLTGLQLNKVH